MSDTPQVTPYQTQDGSWTLYDPELKVHYRSTSGAVTESHTVFLQGTGLIQRHDQDWRVLELGFGSAVNFIQTALAHTQRAHEPQPRWLEYHSVEHRPISPQALEHLEGWPADLARAALEIAHSAPSTHISISSPAHHIKLTLHLLPWDELELPQLDAQAIFFDPFGPEANPSSWTQQAFEVALKHLHPEGVLATYSAAGHVRRAMRAAGLHTGSLPGPGHKREITIASPSASPISHAKRLRSPTPPDETTP